MTRQRNLGPVLALAGAGIALAAAIAGFFVVGGPGDARARRLDEITNERVGAALDSIQCAFNGSGEAPASIGDSLRARGWRFQPDDDTDCAQWNGEEVASAARDVAPTHSGDITYTRLANDRIRICAFFQLPADAKPCSSCYQGQTYDAYFAARPTGAHCYDIGLVRQPVGEFHVYSEPRYVID